MNREILFRGKRVDNGEWVEGNLLIIPGCTAIFSQEDNETDSEIIPSTVGQYTGLTDRNGVKIFEGDIVRAVHNREELNTSYIYFEGGVYWCGLITGHFIDECETLFDQYCECGLEIIGNIHDNPELLKGEENENELDSMQ